MKAEGAPLVEPIEGEQDHSLVTFVWRGGKEVSSVQLNLFSRRNSPISYTVWRTRICSTALIASETIGEPVTSSPSMQERRAIAR